MGRSLLLDKRSLLERVALFAPLGRAELARLAEITATKRLRARQVLFRQGDAGTHAYVIISGRLKVAAAGEDGKQTLLRIMDPGEVIGEISLLDSQPRSGTVTALDPAELLVIQRRDLIPFLEQHPKTAIKLLRALAERLRSISVQLEDRVFLNLPPRLAKKLLALSETYGQPVARGVRIDLKLKQGELGEMVGTSRESINKQLRTWTGQGLLKSEKGYITIVEPRELERLARLEIG